MLNWVDLHPYTLLLTVLVILVVKNGITAVGKKNIEEFSWGLYTKIAPKLGHTKLADLSSKRSEAYLINKEKKSISAQDQYAKWTKLNRQHDKLNAEIEQLTADLNNDKAIVVKYLSTFITVFTALPIWFFRVWFRKSVLFYVPSGVLPYPIERLFAVPFVTIGGVGLTVWMFAANSVLASLILLVTFPFQAPVEPPKKPQPQTQPAQPPAAEQVSP